MTGLPGSSSEFRGERELRLRLYFAEKATKGKAGLCWAALLILFLLTTVVGPLRRLKNLRLRHCNWSITSS